MFVPSLKKIVFKSQIRRRLGPSSIGEGCERKLWKKLYDLSSGLFTFLTYLQHDIFERGQWEEGRVCKHLKRCGWKVERRSVKVKAEGILFRGEMDGIVRDLLTGERYVLEVKTMKQEHFRVLERKGCQQAKFVYWCQCQCYMGMSGIHQALFVVRNKNTEELYQEIIPFDANLYELLLQKFTRITQAEGAPLGYTALKKPHFECSWCAHKESCWKEEKTNEAET